MSRYYIASTTFLALLITFLILDGPVQIPLYWYIILFVVYVVLSTVGAVVLSIQFYVKVISSGSKNGIALTFDDGPVPGKTERLLDLLKEHQIKAAFFCIGKRIAENPELVKRIHEEGHLIGNHSYFHGAAFDLQSSTMITKELADTDSALMNVIGKRSRFFRPPYGVTNPMVAKAVKRRNYIVIGWSIRSFDTVIHDPAKLIRRVTRSLKNGDILLFHDRCDSTYEILPTLLEQSSKIGLKVVRVDELINEKPYA
jgi:peptidoglycan-N-acetylglucosamine deacetylase